jgi:hypothetical protein
VELKRKTNGFIIPSGILLFSMNITGDLGEKEQKIFLKKKKKKIPTKKLMILQN